jgi:hypothetical protein
MFCWYDCYLSWCPYVVSRYLLQTAESYVHLCPWDSLRDEVSRQTTNAYENICILVVTHPLARLLDVSTYPLNKGDMRSG